MAESTTARVRLPKPRQASSIRAEERFRTALTELGATPLFKEWKGVDHPYPVLCAGGHECAPWPSGVFKGQGICRECVGLGAQGAWRAFQRLVTENGGTVLEDRWLGATTRHRVKCRAGHITSPVPHYVRDSGSFCSICAGRSGTAAWKAFRGFVEESGGTVLEDDWRGTHTPHRIVCPGGHALTVRPSKVMSRERIACRTCTVERLAAQFEGLVRAQGGTLLEPYKSSHARHRVRCARGHEVTPTPAHLMAGCGLCRYCGGKKWDVFYVVCDELNGLVKFGVTSHNPRKRLWRHTRDGFDEVVRLFTGLPLDVAPELERMILGALRDAREEPVRGREYFRVRVLPLILDLVDNHPAVRALARPVGASDGRACQPAGS